MPRRQWGSGPQPQSCNGAVTHAPQWDPAPVWSLCVHQIPRENVKGSTWSTADIAFLVVGGCLVGFF